MDEAKEQPLQELNFIAFFNSDDLRKKLNLPAGNRLDTAAMDVDLTLRALKGKDATWPDLRGLRILDLGCGSEISPKSKGTDNWAPYFCRICADHGAEVIGIDLALASEADSKRYAHIGGNEDNDGDVVRLVRENRLKETAGAGFDIIHSTLFTSSPEFIEHLLPQGVSNDEAEKAMEEFMALLKTQASELLKEGGILSIDREESGRIYQKQDGKLIEVVA